MPQTRSETYPRAFFAVLTAALIGTAGYLIPSVTVAASNEYPSSWQVEFQPAAPLPANYQFGRQTTTFAKGRVFPPAAQPLPCDVVWERDMPVTLRDGTVMYTDVLHPAGAPARWPSIIAWSPYGKAIPATSVPSGVSPSEVTGLSKGEGPDAGFWVCHGYAIVDPDPRGVDKSQGDIHVWGGVDGRDGYDVIEWVAKQPWSNGKVGLHGTSWLAMAQWFIAQQRPPHLAALAPWNGMSDIYRQNLVMGGIPNLGFGAAIFGHLTGEHRVERPDLMVRKNPLINDYWSDKAAKLESIRTPAYIVTDVVTDLHRIGTLEGFRRLGSKEKWLRVDNRQEWSDQYDPVNEEDLLRFFDHYLKGADNGWQQTPRVRMSILDPGGSDRLNVPYPSWPLPGTRYTRLYLDASNGGLSSKTVTNAGEKSYPATTGQAEYTYRFDQDTQVTGYLKVHLWVEARDADAQDLFVIAEKLDNSGQLLIPAPESAYQYFPVPPPGTTGRLRVSLRALDPVLSTSFFPVQAFKVEQPVTRGEVVAVDIALLPESVMFHRGEQLRLIISGHEFRAAPPPPRPGVGGMAMPPLPPLPTQNAGTHVIHSGGKYDSYLQIPSVTVTR